MINVRELNVADNESYRSLWRYAITQQASYFRVSPEDDSLADIPTRFTDDSFTLGAFADSRLIGIVSVERDSRKKMNHKVLVSRRCVHPDASGQGIGKALINSSIAMMTAIGAVRYLYLTVLASNRRAIHLYSSLGFKVFAREPGAVQIDGQFIDELQMAYQIVGE